MSNLFARITKVDEETRTVTGRASQETIDRDGEVMDYSSSVPHFKAWSAECFADSNGLSHGNVRAMHGATAAGVLTEIEFNDQERAIDVVAKIVDDDCWKKVITGTFTGFSIGGRYAKKWTDISSGKPVTRYTAVPNELSLVDRPSCPQAKFFSIHKRDGRVVKHAFATHEDRYMMSDELGSFLKLDGSLNAIRKIHAQGSRRLPPDFLHKYESMGSKDATVAAINKAHAAAGKKPVNLRDLHKMIERGRLRKLAFPPESSNSDSNGRIADTGATNSFRDNPAPTNKPTLIPRAMPTDVSASPNISAAVNSYGVNWKASFNAAADAIKQDLLRPKRWGAAE